MVTYFCKSGTFVNIVAFRIMKQKYCKKLPVEFSSFLVECSLCKFDILSTEKQSKCKHKIQQEKKLCFNFTITFHKINANKNVSVTTAQQI